MQRCRHRRITVRDYEYDSYPGSGWTVLRVKTRNSATTDVKPGGSGRKSKAKRQLMASATNTVRMHTGVARIV